jgi:hypothetical protein
MMVDWVKDQGAVEKCWIRFSGKMSGRRELIDVNSAVGCQKERMKGTKEQD